MTDLTDQLDPEGMARFGAYCQEYRPDGRFFCTRPQGHAGQHRAHWSSGKVCCPDWGLDERLLVGEGL